MSALQRPTQRSLNQTKQLMVDLAMYGRYYPPTGFRNEADVRAAYAQRGLDFDHVANESRALTAQFPFENLIPMGSWFTSGGMQYVGSDGITTVSMDSPGVITSSQYEASFQRAVEYIDRAITQADSGPMLDGLVAGVSSIEAYTRHRAAIWNAAHPNNQLVETPPKRIPFDDKVRDWIPQMAAGQRLDLSDRVWQSFDELRVIRDRTQVHAHEASFGFTYVEIADIANRFAIGVGQLMRRLHLLFGEQIPPVILRACYMPQVTTSVA